MTTDCKGTCLVIELSCLLCFLRQWLEQFDLVGLQLLVAVHGHLGTHEGKDGFSEGR